MSKTVHQSKQAEELLADPKVWGSLLVLLLYKPCDIIIVFENENILDSSSKLIKHEGKLLAEGTLL